MIAPIFGSATHTTRPAHRHDIPPSTSSTAKCDRTATLKHPCPACHPQAYTPFAKHRAAS